MTTKRKYNQRFWIVFRHLFRSTEPWMLLLVVGLLTGLGVFSNASYWLLSELMRSVFPCWPKGGAWLANAILFVLFVALTAYAWVQATHGVPGLQLTITPVTKEPDRIRALIVFLSNVKVNEGEHPAPSAPWPEAENFLSGQTKDPAWGRHPWWMPLQGIRRHRTTLEWIIIVPSSESQGQRIAFIDFVKAYLAHHNIATPIRYPDLKELGATIEHVNFEDPSAVSDLLHYIWDHLAPDEPTPGRPTLESDEVIVDITSGQKPNSVAGAIVAFGPKRLFQYVSTNKIEEVRFYDIAYV